MTFVTRQTPQKGNSYSIKTGLEFNIELAVIFVSLLMLTQLMLLASFQPEALETLKSE